MTDIQIVEYRDWSQFKAEYLRDLFGDGIFRASEFVFRGQSDEAWALETSFDRWFRLRYREGSTDRLAIADALIREFKAELTRRYPQHDSLAASEAAVIALAQHFGVPTRLLDWSGSPYIAAFFAFSDAMAMSMTSKHIGVWALRRSAPVWNAESGVALVELAGGGNDRLRQQMGCFTLNRTPYRTLEEYVRTGPEGPPALIKAIVPTSEAITALADLDAMSINHFTTFPEIAGCALAAQLRVLIGGGGRK